MFKEISVVAQTGGGMADRTPQIAESSTTVVRIGENFTTMLPVPV
jgi:hypothetical protein